MVRLEIRLEKDSRYPFEITIGRICYLLKCDDAKKLHDELEKALNEYEETQPCEIVGFEL